MGISRRNEAAVSGPITLSDVDRPRIDLKGRREPAEAASRDRLWVRCAVAALVAMVGLSLGPRPCAADFVTFAVTGNAGGGTVDSTATFTTLGGGQLSVVVTNNTAATNP